MGALVRFYRFNLDTNTEYELLRVGVDTVLGYSSPSTSISPYSSAPVDQKGRVVLNLIDSTPGYGLLVAGADLLVAAGKAKELTQDEYDASFFPAPSGGGGGVSSWNDLTDRPFSSVGSGLSVVSGVLAVSYSYSLPVATASVLGGVKQGSNVTIAADGTISVAAPVTSLSYSSLTGVPSTFAPSTHASTHQTGGADAVSSVVVTPASLAADQNDWAIGTGDVFRVAGTAARNITGIAAGTSGLAILLVNVGTFALTLKHQNASSAATNRITVPWAGDCVLAANGGAVVLVYDSTSSTWRVV
jgi:hypothetical protein